VDQYNVNVWITYDITLRNTYYNTTGRRSIFPATEDTRNMIFMQIELSSRLLKPAFVLESDSGDDETDELRRLG